MPNAESVEKALRAIRRAADHDYFFGRLRSPDWIEPLWERGLFRDPPAPVREEGYISFPVWAESRYLARMASQAPELVLKVIRGLPPTENVRVLGDLLDAAAAMPPKVAAKLASKAAGWLDSPYQLLLPEKAGRLVEHLASGAEANAALRLARALFAVVPDLRAEDEEYRTRPEPRARFDAWEYEQLLTGIGPVLVDAAGISALSLLCDLLEEAVRLSSYEDEDAVGSDHSFIWRPAIEDHEQNTDFGVRPPLVSAIRDMAERLVGSDPDALQDVISLLERRQPRVFERVALHLLRLFADLAPDLAAERLTDETLFKDIGVRHEYALLSGARFGALRREEQERILGWIEAEGRADLIRDYPGPDGQPPTDRLVEERSKYAQLERLEPIRNSLPVDWVERYQAFAKEVGEPEHPDFPAYTSSGFYGPVSPVQPAELGTMPLGDVLAYLERWNVPGNFMGPSQEGLARALQSATAADPSRFAPGASRFRTVRPAYARGLLDGLRDAVREGKAFQWEGVLALCVWVSGCPELRVGSEAQDPADLNWGWLRSAAADLIEDALQRDSSGISPADREAVWAVLEPLTADRDPTPEQEQRFGGSNMDPSTLSLNTVRGKAFHAVMRYLFWVRRTLAGTEADGGDARWLDEIPEARRVLDLHLDPTRDPSPAVRSVYGQWFPWLLSLDREWAEENTSRIFPESSGEAALHDAAWEAYLAFSGPWERAFQALRTEYDRAIDRLGALDEGHAHIVNPEQRLAEHLVNLYVRGSIPLREGLMARFYERAPAALRGYAIGFAGRVLRGDSEVSAAALQNLRQMWESRLEAAAETGSHKEHELELAAFGLWFASGRFAEDWSLDQLRRGLRLSPRTEATGLVLERLAALAVKWPSDSLACLRLLAQGDRRGWEIPMWSEHVKGILVAALAGSDAGVREAAVSFIHEMGARGIDSYRDLLP